MPPSEVIEAPTAQALARLAESRDVAAWRLLVERHGAAMYRAAFAVTRDEHLASDACQEAFLLVRDGAGRFKPRSHDAEAAAQGWLVRVATTTALMLMRGMRRRQRREHAVPAELAAAPVSAAEAADERLAESLRAEMAALPDTYREALLLHVYAGLDYDAIAGAIGTTSGNARVRVHRAIARLRSRLSRVGAAGALLPTLTPIAPPPALAGKCLSLLHVPTTSAVSTTALTGGLTLMTKFALTAAALVCAGSLALPFARAGAEEHHDGDKPKAEAPHADKPKDASKSDYTEGQKGTAVGTVAETKVEKAAVVIVTEAGQRMRFIAQWVGGMPKDGGGPDKAMVEQIAKLHVGDKVSIDWLFQEHLRVIAIKVLGEKK